MKCEEVMDLLVGYLEDSLDPAPRQAVADHLRTCAACRHEQARVAALLDHIGNSVPELPGQDIEAGFLRQLAEEKAKLAPVAAYPPNTSTANRGWRYAGIAAAIALVMVTFAFFAQQRVLLREMTALEREYQQLHKVVALALIEDQSASKRLQAVRYATALSEQDAEIIEALIDKMQHDKHVNVRLAAASALARYAGNAVVTSALIDALSTETNSNMQIAIIQIMVAAREKSAVPVMRELLRQQELLPYVREQISAGLDQII